MKELIIIYIVMSVCQIAALLILFSSIFFSLRNRMKAFKSKLGFRGGAIISIIFSDRFILTTYKDGRQVSKISFCKKEIDEAYNSKKKH